MKNFPRLTKAAMTLLVLLMTTTAWAQTPRHKVVVIADPHVMCGDLYNNGSAWQTYPPEWGGEGGSRELDDMDDLNDLMELNGLGGFNI